MKIFFKNLPFAYQALFGMLLLWSIAFGLYINIWLVLFLMIIFSTYIMSLSSDWFFFCSILGLHRPKKIVITSICTIMLGVFPAIAYRQYLDEHILLNSLSWMSIVYVAIGVIEELVTRGLLQGLAMMNSKTYGILVGTFSHTFYKVLLFFHYPNLDIFAIFIFSFIIGLMFAFLRIWSQSVLTCMLSHGLFDLLVYGDGSITPWWLWN